MGNLQSYGHKARKRGEQQNEFTNIAIFSLTPTVYDICCSYF